MRVAVVGATGRTGVLVVRELLSRGHTVHALARTPEKGATLGNSDRLTTTVGDVLDVDNVVELVAGADAVVDVSGPVKGGPPDLRRRTAEHLLTAMDKGGVQRFVGLTGAGVRTADDRPKLVDRAFGAALRLVAGRVLADSTAYVDAVRASTLDWTIVRVPRLTDRLGRGSVRAVAGVGKESGTQLARADLARFVAGELEDPRWVCRLPVVSW